MTIGMRTQTPYDSKVLMYRDFPSAADEKMSVEQSYVEGCRTGYLEAMGHLKKQVSMFCRMGDHELCAKRGLKHSMVPFLSNRFLFPCGCQCGHQLGED